MIRFLILIFFVLQPTPTPDATYIVFRWNDALFAHSTVTGEVTPLEGFSATPPDVYQHTNQPLAEGLGFYHGVWSSNRSQFAYLEIRQPFYNLRLQAGDTNQLLMNGGSSPDDGFLDPIGWTDNGEIVLLERLTLNHLYNINVWLFDPTTYDMKPHSTGQVGLLTGRTAVLPGGTQVFLGFDVEKNIGYLLDIPTEKIKTFPSRLAETIVPVRGFRYYALEILGAFASPAFDKAIEVVEVDNPAQPHPFLYWSLPDEHRSITCYPDDAWTTANFDVTCPGMSAPRNYQGHQGTDIGGKPDGLPTGTPVYPAAMGFVLTSHRDCLMDNPSCNDSYGNTVTMEHIVVVDGQAQSWYTGYAHLQTVLAKDYDYRMNTEQPIALSGETGTGGEHLHFEVRTLEGWVNPWDNRNGEALWMGGSIHPLSAVSEVGDIPQVLAVCTSITGNNIRSGAGTTYEIVGQMVQGVTYHVREIAFVDSGAAYGNWYRVQYEGGEGWLWSGLLNCP